MIEEQSFRNSLKKLVAVLRSFFPEQGIGYELFDCSVLLFVMGFVGYVLNEPQPIATEALSGPFAVFPYYVWGTAMSVTAVFGVLCAYSDKECWKKTGVVTVIIACSFWAICYLIGWLNYDAPSRSLISVFIYFWIARRLMRIGHGQGEM